MDLTTLITLAGSATSIIGSAAAIAIAYKQMDARINAAVESRVGTRMRAIESAADRALDDARLQQETKVVVLGTPGDSRDKTMQTLRLSGWRLTDAISPSEDPATVATLRGADVVVLDKPDPATARAVAEFFGLPAFASDPTTAAYLPSIVWYTGPERVDPTPFGDGVVTANSRQTLRTHVANGATVRRWAQRARA